MAKRNVFGRLRRMDTAGNRYTIEMRDNGIYIRQLHSRKVWLVPFRYLFKFCKPQMELFDEAVDKSNEGKPLPGVQEGQLVPAGGEGLLLHEDTKPTPEAVQVGGDGLAALVGLADNNNGEAEVGIEANPQGELPTPDGGVAGPDEPGPSGTPGGSTGS